MRVTIKDVAREAGVSVSTVSRMMNGSGPVSPEARARIQRAREALRYVPNDAARSLITNRTHTLGVLLPDLHGAFYSEVIRGIDQTAQQGGYHLLVSSSHNERSEIERAMQAMQGRVDALIVMSPNIDARTLQKNLLPSLPVVLLNCKVDGDAYDSLNIDNYGGAYAMTRHLAALGHTRIALIRGTDQNYDAQERLRGYRAALAEAGCPHDPALEYPGDFTEASGYAAAQRLVALDEAPTAVFASNDTMAIGALSALAEAGMRVPEDVAIAGFDDIPIARYMRPTLTSVRVPLNDMGERAMRRLLFAIDHKNTHPRQQEVLQTTLVVRQSCGGTPT